MKVIALRLAFSLLCGLVLQSVAFGVGVIDPTFGTNGVVTTPVTFGFTDSAVVFQPDGKYVVAGVNGNTLVIVRFNTDGSLDTSFGTGGTASHSVTGLTVSGVALQPDGKLFVVGRIDTTPPPASPTDFFIARFNSQGGFDPTFGTNGIKTLNGGGYDNVRSIAVQPDGKLLAAGGTLGSTRFVSTVFRLTATGDLDTTFGNQGFYQYFAANTEPFVGQDFYQVGVLSNGRVVLAGSLVSGAFYGFYVVMLDVNGVPVSDFGTAGVVLRQHPSCCTISPGPTNFLVMPSGRLLVSGQGPTYVFNTDGSQYRKIVFGSVPLSMLPNGRVVAGGSVITEDGVIGRIGFLGRSFGLQDGKILVLRSGTGGQGIVHTRLQRVTSSATLNPDVNGDEGVDLAVYNSQTQTYSRYRGGNPPFVKQEYLTKVVPGTTESVDSLGNVYYDGASYWRDGLLTSSHPVFASLFENRATLTDGLWGAPGDMPVGGDFNGDGLADLTVFRPSDGVWYSMKGPGGGNAFFRWGLAGDKPVPADYDYDGRTDYAIFRPSTGTWWVHRSSNDSYFTINFGIASDIPLTGDYDADGFADFTIFRPSEGNWYQFLTTDGFRITRFGLNGDYPIPGDYDNDGRHDIAVWRAGIWHYLRSSLGYSSFLFGDGSAAAKPVSIRFDE
jgi:uncharacterized delta-60 repeat protein